MPQAPGGANDAVARIVAQKLAEQAGAPFVVYNRPGAGGNIGTAAAARAWDIDALLPSIWRT